MEVWAGLVSSEERSQACLPAPGANVYFVVDDKDEDGGSYDVSQPPKGATRCY